MENSRSPKFTKNEFDYEDSEMDVLEDDVILNEDLLCGREEKIMQWLQALDMQIMGACRSDERLKPLLKVGVADDGFLSHLTQHFEASEVGLLARCFCIPLVSIRVGKIDKRGSLLCPTNSRGNLNLTLLPTSALRILFVGDNGNIERLATLSSQSQCSTLAIEEIVSDNSGRSFLIKISEDKVFYFWCSEKSKLLGHELMLKMKDILSKKPSVAELSGISESRLACFVTCIRTFLVESKVSSGRANASGTFSPHVNSTPELSETASADLSSVSSMLVRHSIKPAGKGSSLHQGSVSPELSFLIDGLSVNPSSSEFVAREKSNLHGNGHFSVVDNPDIASSVIADSSSSNILGCMKLPETIDVLPSFPLISPSPLESLGKSAAPLIQSSVPQVTPFSSAFLSPHYCWCPPGASALEHSVAVASFPTSSIEMVPFPSSSLVTVDKSNSLLMPPKAFDLGSFPTEFPALLPDPLVRIPLPSSQQITFTPLMCDPIVHIPVIDVCSSRQGYLVSASPAITTMPPLHPSWVNPLFPEIDPVVEKGAQETLRLLISNSAATSSQLMDVIPAIFSTTDDSQSVYAMSSRALYGSTLSINAVASTVASLGLVSESEVLRGSNSKASCSGVDGGVQKEGLTKFGGSNPEDGGALFADVRKPSTN